MAGRASAHLHDEVELEGVEKRFVLGTHAQGSLRGSASAAAHEPQARVYWGGTSRNRGSLNSDCMVLSSSNMKLPKLCTRDIMRSYDSFRPTTPPYLQQHRHARRQWREQAEYFTKWRPMSMRPGRTQLQRGVRRRGTA
jgi:hypothetical protein